MTHEDASSNSRAPLEELFAQRLEIEHNIISHRMTWLMTLNGFLLGGAALVGANFDKFDGPQALTLVTILISVVGTVCNESCLFSNYWATRAIREAGAVLSREWKNTLAPAEANAQRLRMRLYGRDPVSFVGPPFMKPSAVLHPWLLLPAVFVCAFSLGAIPVLVANGSEVLFAIWLSITLVSGLLFAILPEADRRVLNRRWIVHAKQNPDQLPDEQDDGWPSAKEQRREFRQIRASVRDQLPRHGNIKRPWRFGTVSKAAYQAFRQAKNEADTANRDQ